MKPDNLKRLLNPKTIAVFGGRFAEAVITQCDKMGFAGKIWPIHPKREQIAGRTCVRSVANLPTAPDAAFIGVNRHETINIAGQLSAAGAGGAVCYASGFKETGDEELHNRLIQAAGAMPVLGPNCYGFINYLDGALLWPDQQGGKRAESGAAILMQSSNIAVNLTMNRRSLPLAYMIALGNQAMVGMSDLITILCEDPRVTAIGLHIEALDDITRFARAIEIAHQYQMPVVVVKTGRSEKGAAITLTHTASLGSNDAVMDALFKRLGVARVDTISQFLECLKLLHVFGPLPDAELVSLSCSGGEASMVSDAAIDSAVDFSDFSPADIERIQPTVHELVNISNPFDYHTFDWADTDRLQATFCAVLQAGKTLNLLVMDMPRSDRCEIGLWLASLSAWQAAVTKTGARAAVLSTLSDCMPEDIAEQLIEHNIVPLSGVEDALTVITAAVSIEQGAPGYQPLDPILSVSDDVLTLDEYQSKQRLAEFGIACPKSRLCSSIGDALAFAASCNFPLVAKAVGSELAHKTEQGAVKLHLSSDAELTAAMRELLDMSQTVLVEQMITDCELELILGVSRDPVAGLYMLIGAGGVLAELLEDTGILLLPFDRVHAEHALEQLKVAAIINGFRCRPAIDTTRLIDSIINIQDFVLAHQDTLQEMDINPLMLTRDGQAIAADALLRFTKQSN